MNTLKFSVYNYYSLQYINFCYHRATTLIIHRFSSSVDVNLLTLFQTLLKLKVEKIHAIYMLKPFLQIHCEKLHFICVFKSFLEFDLVMFMN